MTKLIDSIAAIAAQYDVVVFDQWGVLHNGTTAYPGAAQAVAGVPGYTAVLSNSGKRAAPNAARIAEMGFDTDAFDFTMTSGEALWRDVARRKISATRLFAIERQTGDAATWAEGLDIELTTDLSRAEAVLLMGLPDGETLDDWTGQIGSWAGMSLPLYCSNPDRHSPRVGGLVTSPGALAFAYQDMGGETHFYGKPHAPVFAAVKDVFGAGRYLMVGDSMEHDIKGAQGVGWDSLLVQGGLYADRFAAEDGASVVQSLAQATSCQPPTYRIEGLR